VDDGYDLRRGFNPALVTTFFLAFGILEDSGYLPRLAALSNRLFQMVGLNGKAVLPMVLGLGCVTMATLTTRVLESKRERLLVTLLLALAVPCSAQLGVVMGMLAGISFTATLIWGGVVLLVLLMVGWLGLPPQTSAAFLMGFLRRDFGATGLFMMQAQGLLNPVQVVVAMVTITLFIPFIASVMMIAKERGWRKALGMVILIFPLAFLAGGLLNRLLLASGWIL
jgi:Fe2+ transport system protein B